MSVDNLIIDGTNLEYKIFFVSKNSKQITETGEQVGCIYKYLQTFKNLVEKFNPTEIYIAWDRKLTTPSTNFRKELLGGKYKFGRIPPADIEEMFNQELRLVEMLEALGAKNIFPNVLEADDIVAWLARTLPGTNMVVSGDNDLYQLVDDRTSVHTLKETITYTNFTSIVGVPLCDFKLYKAIKGDKADTIPGLPGYGAVYAKQLAAEWDTQTVLTEEQKAIVERNMKLVDLDYGYKAQPYELDIYEKQLKYLKSKKSDLPKFRELCEKYEFYTYLAHFEEWRSITKRNEIVNLVSLLSVQ